MFVFRGNYIISGTISCVHKKPDEDRKSTRLNSSHVAISYAVFCLKKNSYYHEPNPTPYSVTTPTSNGSIHGHCVPTKIAGAADTGGTKAVYPHPTPPALVQGNPHT